MSIAAGAGFYECVILVMLLILIVLNLLSPLEVLYKRRRRNITLSVEMEHTTDIARITDLIEDQNAHIYDIDIETGPSPASAIFVLQMSRQNSSHSAMLSSIAELDCVRSVCELIS